MSRLARYLVTSMIETQNMCRAMQTAPHPRRMRGRAYGGAISR